MRTLCISKEDGKFTVDEKSRPGSPAVGRGRTMHEALGDWLHHNQDYMGIKIDVDASALAAEMRRRTRELAKR